VAIHRATRKALAERSMQCCEVCGKPNPTDPHHRKRKSQGGLDTLANLLDLCRDCHNDIHHEPTRAKRYGYLLSRNAAPEHVPVRRWSRVHGARVLTLLRDDGTINEEVEAWQEVTLWAE
jgi:hypothetical protein